VPKRLTDEERAWRAVPEKQLQARILADARKHGWLAYHFGDSRKMVRRGHRYVPVGDRDAWGFPDTVIVHPKHGVVFIEVKKELGKLEPKQIEARDGLLEAGARWYLLKPSNYDHIASGLEHGFEDI